MSAFFSIDHLIQDGHQNGLQTSPILPYTQWTYPGVTMPSEFHIGGAFIAFLHWLEGRPFMGNDNIIASKEIVYSILLAIGLLMRDIASGQFIDEDEPDPTLPLFIINSALTWKDHELLLKIGTLIQTFAEDFISYVISLHVRLIMVLTQV